MNPAWNSDGLAPVVVQDVSRRSVLMLGWMNRAALDATRRSGRVTFWSRSRGELWEKGATSGNWLEVQEIRLDCDDDALLVEAIPHGPTCHTGRATCWGDVASPEIGRLDRLWATIGERLESPPANSYTVELASGGPDATGRKLTEEATEVLLAAKDHEAGSADDRRVAEEAADLIYHLMVLLAERNVDFMLVEQVLDERAAI